MMLLLHRATASKLASIISRRTCMPVSTHCQFDSARRPAAGRSIRCAHQQDEHNNIQHQLHQHQPHRLIRCFSSSGEKDKDLSSDNTSAGENNANDIETVDKDDEDDKSATGSEEAYVGTDNENTEDDESTVKDTESTTNNDQQTPGYFPWRHDSEVPTRILEKNDFSGMPNNYRSRFVRRLVACRELDISPLAAIGPIPFFARSWETEMANNFAIAFELALEELLKSIFHEDRIQVKNRRADDQVIIVDSSVKSDADSDVDTSNNLDKNEYLNSMMDKKLIAKYQSVNTDNFHLKLSIKPTEAILESIFAIPLLSREIVEKKPHLRGAYQRIENAFGKKATYSEVKQMTYDLADEIGEDDAYNRTVIVDATIYCKEFYQVKDAKTGEIVDGMEDISEEEEVVHNVRFEVVTEKDDSGTGRKVGQWKIIDFDDMLEGNVFH